MLSETSHRSVTSNMVNLHFPHGLRSYWSAADLPGRVSVQHAQTARSPSPCEHQASLQRVKVSQCSHWQQVQAGLESSVPATRSDLKRAVTSGIRLHWHLQIGFTCLPCTVLPLCLLMEQLQSEHNPSRLAIPACTALTDLGMLIWAVIWGHLICLVRNSIMKN